MNSPKKSPIKTNEHLLIVNIISNMTRTICSSLIKKTILSCNLRNKHVMANTPQYKTENPALWQHHISL